MSASANNENLTAAYRQGVERKRALLDREGNA